jgi:hypothetical protein
MGEILYVLAPRARAYHNEGKRIGIWQFQHSMTSLQSQQKCFEYAESGSSPGPIAFFCGFS